MSYGIVRICIVYLFLLLTFDYFVILIFTQSITVTMYLLSRVPLNNMHCIYYATGIVNKHTCIQMHPLREHKTSLDVTHPLIAYSA